MARFASAVGVSQMTIKKKHFEVKTTVLRYMLRKIFSNLLVMCLPKYSGRVKSPGAGILYEPYMQLYVENYSDAEKLRVRNSENKYLPIEDVSDIHEWDILLDTKYYDDIGNELQLYIKLARVNLDFTFNCTKYDEYNRENGKNIISNTIIHATNAM
jgi:hypothetical protein